MIGINPHNPQGRLIKQVVKVIENGGIVAYPTDTVYGLGCDIFNKKAIRAVHKLKGQPERKPFSFICPDIKELSRFARVTNYAYKTLRRLLPGPYTFVLEGTREVPKIMLTRQKTVGIRVPDHAICQALTMELGRPILTTSATDGKGAAYASAWEIEQALGKRIDLVVDGGPVPGELSSVVSLVGDYPEIIREGAGDVEEFRF